MGSSGQHDGMERILKGAFASSRCASVCCVLGMVLTALCFLGAFLSAPLVNGAPLSGQASATIGGMVIDHKLLFSQKIFYFHVPVAIVGFIALGGSAYYAIRFLMARSERELLDIKSTAWMRVALVFIAATMLSGILWTRFEWGVWWVWEPRLTTYFILTLMAIAYFVLSNALEDPEQRATFCSVFAILVFLNAPISFAITRLVPSSVHPVVLKSGSGLPPAMLIPFLLGLAGMMCMGYALYVLNTNNSRAQSALELLKERYEDLAQR